MIENYIQNEIKTRKITYYPVSESDLETLREKGILSEIFMTLTSLFLSVFLTVILTSIVNSDIQIDLKNLLKVIGWVSGILTLILLVLTIIFIWQNKKLISSFINKEPENYTIGSLIKQTNPNHYVGTTHIAVNISVVQRDNFLELFHHDKRFDLLKTSHHDNTIKTDYFTFAITNGNENLVKDFRALLEKNEVSFTDFEIKK